MKIDHERLVDVIIGKVKIEDGTANFPIQIENDEGKYNFTNGWLKEKPWEMQDEDVSEIYEGNFEYEDPEDSNSIHTKPAKLFVDEKEHGRGWLEIDSLVPEEKDMKGADVEKSGNG